MELECPSTPSLELPHLHINLGKESLYHRQSVSFRLSEGPSDSQSLYGARGTTASCLPSYDPAENEEAATMDGDWDEVCCDRLATRPRNGVALL